MCVWSSPLVRALTLFMLWNLQLLNKVLAVRKVVWTVVLNAPVDTDQSVIQHLTIQEWYEINKTGTNQKSVKVGTNNQNIWRHKTVKVCLIWWWGLPADVGGPWLEKVKRSRISVSVHLRGSDSVTTAGQQTNVNVLICVILTLNKVTASSTYLWYICVSILVDLFSVITLMCV